MTRIILSLIVFLAAGCTSLQTASDLNSQADFSSLKTFAWLEDGGQSANDVRLHNPLVQETVRTAVEQALVAKGYEKAEGSQADFVVVWFGAIEKKLKQDKLDQFYAPYGYAALYRDPVLNPGPPRTILEYEEGTLIIDILEPQGRKLLWRGTGSRPLAEEQSEQTALRNLNRAVTKILEPFPSR